MSDPIQQRLEDIKYPAWQPEARAVMLEIVPAKIKEKFILAEAAMAKRAMELKSNSEDDLDERAAMTEEREALELALAEILQTHPELRKPKSV